MRDLSKLLGGEADVPSKLSPQEIQAKMDVIKELMQEMVEAMGGDVKSGMDEMGALKKVTVAAPDAESLEEGLDVAKEIVPALPDEEALDPEAVEAKVDAGPSEEKAHPMAHFMQDEGQDLYSLMQKKKKKALG